MKTALCVEDNYLIATTVTDCLREIGYEPVHAPTAELALAVLTDCDRYDVLLANVHLPGRDGLDMAMAAREKCPRLPIVFVTGYPPAELAGAFIIGPVLNKPFTTTQLAEAIGRATAMTQV